MKNLKTLKIVLIAISIFSLSACELVEEPNFDEDASTTGEEVTKDKEYE